MPRKVAVRTLTGTAGAIGVGVVGVVVGVSASSVTSVRGCNPARRSTTFSSWYAFANSTHASATATALHSTTRTTWFRTSQGASTNENAAQAIATAVRTAIAWRLSAADRTALNFVPTKTRVANPRTYCGISSIAQNVARDRGVRRRGRRDVAVVTPALRSQPRPRMTVLAEVNQPPVPFTQ